MRGFLRNHNTLAIGAILLASFSAVWFLAPISLSGAALAATMGLSTACSLLWSRYRLQIACIRLGVPLQYAEELRGIDTSGALQAARLRVFSGLIFYRSSSVAAFQEETLSFARERMPAKRYRELVEIAHPLVGTLPWAGEDGGIAHLLRAHYFSKAQKTGPEVLELAKAYGTEVTAIMLEHGLPHEYAVTLVADTV